MKHEWRKKEKAVYLSKNAPEFIQLPAYQFLSISGKGNPNSEAFSEYISVLYALSYAIKMTLKKECELEGYFDYTVYPLEGVWDISEEAKKAFDGTVNKNELVFTLMIRQPHFVTANFVEKMKVLTRARKPHRLLDQVKFEKIEEGPCIQMLHIGSYDTEDASFRRMEHFAQTQQLERLSKVHREIYLSDFRKVAPEKLKTALRFQVIS